MRSLNKSLIKDKNTEPFKFWSDNGSSGSVGFSCLNGHSSPRLHSPNLCISRRRISKQQKKSNFYFVSIKLLNGAYLSPRMNRCVLDFVCSMVNFWLFSLELRLLLLICVVRMLHWNLKDWEISHRLSIKKSIELRTGFFDLFIQILIEIISIRFIFRYVLFNLEHRIAYLYR